MALSAAECIAFVESLYLALNRTFLLLHIRHPVGGLVVYQRKERFAGNAADLVAEDKSYLKHRAASEDIKHRRIVSAV